MSAALSIGWFVWLLVAIYVVNVAHGFTGLVRMFPEGYRWWQFPAQIASLANFAAVVLLNPF